jgi:hypothetical protein
MRDAGQSGCWVSFIRVHGDQPPIYGLSKQEQPVARYNPSGIAATPAVGG